MTVPLTPNYVAFDEEGRFIDLAGFEALLASVPTEPTDLFVFSHGWNNSFADASDTYGAVIDQMRAVAGDVAGLRPEPFRPLALGVIWPSKAWDDESPGEFESPFPRIPAALTAAVYDVLSPARATVEGFRHDVMRVQQLVVQDRLDAPQMREFLDLLRQHAQIEDLNVFEPDAPIERLEGLFGSGYSARDVFRIFTYWQMKRRAGVVGRNGVRVLVAAAQKRFPTTRVHLIGHSFGCKVVLATVADPTMPLPRPVQTVVLLQGAVSFEAMAEQVTQTQSPGGYRTAVEAARVDGPIVVTFSSLDRACSKAYPLGSRLANQTGELELPFLDRFQALGAVGAKGIGGGLEQSGTMVEVGQPYHFTGRGVWSINGGPPGAYISGHSDIRTARMAWLIWCAVQRR